MIRHFAIIFTVLAGSAGVLCGQSEPAHPRLLFGAEDVQILRNKITQSPWKEMYQTLLEDAESGQYRDYQGKATPQNPEGPADPYGESVNAYRCAFIYQMTGDDAWAAKSRFYVQRRILDNTKGTSTVRSYAWGDPNIKGLGLYFTGKAVAMAYDWCYGSPSWTRPADGGEKTFQQLVSEKLLEQADVIAMKGGREQNTDPASNWQGNRGGSALLCYLATDEKFDQARYQAMLKKTREYLQRNAGGSPDSRGWNIEGVGYLGFPMGHVAPAAIAARRRNPADDLFGSVPGIAYLFWTQYAATVRFTRPEYSDMPVWILHPDFGDDNASADDANGCYGLAFGFSRAELVPGLKYWYNRLLAADKNFDYTRAGTIYSILYFPPDTPEAEPLSIPAWREGFLDGGGNGFFTYRNQYRDEADMVAQIYLKLRGNRGHNGPDALSFRILGLNTAWAVGGGRYGLKDNGVDIYKRQMNTLYPSSPDGVVKTSEFPGKVVGTPQVFPDGSGHVISSIPVNNVGTKNHKRWFVSDYSRTAGVEAVYVIGDTSDDGLFWQWNTLDEPGIKITHAGNAFTIEGRDGATLRGTVLLPGGTLPWATGKRQRGSAFKARSADRPNFAMENQFIHFQGSGNYLVVVTVARKGQVHPEVEKTGDGVVGSAIRVGPKVYVLDDADVRYETAGKVPPQP